MVAPGTAGSSARNAGVVVAVLIVSGMFLFWAPVGLDATYSVVDHTVSESAGQGVDGAWAARSGFLLFGLAVALLAHWSRRPLVARGAFAVFAAAMAGVATFPARSWEAAAEHSDVEDLLHSVFATTMGFAFALGVAAVAVDRGPGWRADRIFDAVALVASVAIPLRMVASDNSIGLYQRLMFLIAYLWFAREALSTRNRTIFV